MRCEFCGLEPHDETWCRSERSRARKAKQRIRKAFAEAIGWQRHHERSPVTMDVIEGTGERIPMTGSHTARCRCGLELRAHTERELDELRERHRETVCLAVHRADHWSVFTAARQRRRPTWRGRGDRDKLDEPGEEPGEVPDPVEEAA